MPPVTGADLPSEVIAKILSYYQGIVSQREGYQQWKKGLVSPSLVCKYWAECIRPALFQDIKLRDASDLHFLESMIASPHFNDSSLHGAFKHIRAQCRFPPLPAPWLHHLHSLMGRLPQTQFWCYVERKTGDTLISIPVRWPPFTALPRVPPSFYSLRFSSIQITRSELKSTTELARLVDSFPALQQCYFFRLKFLDPSPTVQAPRIPRKVPRALWQCQIAECADMSISAQARLTLDVLAAAPRLGLAAEDPRWSALLDALLASVPNGFRRARVILRQSAEGEGLDGQAPGKVVLGFSPTDTSVDDDLLANVWVMRAGATHTRAGDASAYVSEISLTASFAAAGNGDPPNFDGVREAAASDYFNMLEFWVRKENVQDEAGVRALLRSVLRCEQLTGALERGVLQLRHYVRSAKTGEWEPKASFDHRQLLHVLAQRPYTIVDGMASPLDDDEVAEYMALFTGHEMDNYLLHLPALRAERAKAKACSSQGASGSPETDGDAVSAPHTRAGGRGHADEDGKSTEAHGVENCLAKA